MNQKFELDADQRQKWKKVLEKQMDEASRNVLAFLKDIAVHRHHTEAQVQHGRSRHSFKKNWTKGFFWNLLCACFVIPAFFALMWFFETGGKRKPFGRVL